MPPETLTTPVVESPGAETPSQEAAPETQVPAQSQETTPAKVETGYQQPQNTATPRAARPSDFYKMRDEIRNLKASQAEKDKQLAELNAFVQEFRKQNAGAAPSKFDVDRFVAQPDVVMKELIQQEIKSLREEVEGWKQAQTQTQLEREKQEALGVLFPKTSADLPENPILRAEKSTDRAVKIQEIFDSYPILQQLIDAKPLETAKIIEKLLEEKPQSSSPKVIPKSLMGGNARGNPNIGGGKVERKAEDVMAEIRKMSAEENEKPQLRFDEERRAKKKMLLNEATQLATKK